MKKIDLADFEFWKCMNEDRVALALYKVTSDFVQKMATEIGGLKYLYTGHEILHDEFPTFESFKKQRVYKLGFIVEQEYLTGLETEKFDEMAMAMYEADSIDWRQALKGRQSFSNNLP